MQRGKGMADLNEPRWIKLFWKYSIQHHEKNTFFMLSEKIKNLNLDSDPELLHFFKNNHIKNIFQIQTLLGKEGSHFIEVPFLIEVLERFPHWAEDLEKKLFESRSQWAYWIEYWWSKKEEMSPSMFEKLWVSSVQNWLKSVEKKEQGALEQIFKFSLLAEGEGQNNISDSGWKDLEGQWKYLRQVNPSLAIRFREVIWLQCLCRLIEKLHEKRPNVLRFLAASRATKFLRRWWNSFDPQGLEDTSALEMVLSKEFLYKIKPWFCEEGVKQLKADLKEGGWDKEISFKGQTTDPLGVFHKDIEWMKGWEESPLHGKFLRWIEERTMNQECSEWITEEAMRNRVDWVVRLLTWGQLEESLGCAQEKFKSHKQRL